MADKTRSHLQAVLQGGQSVRDCPGRFLQNFDGLSLLLLLPPRPPSSRLSSVGGGNIRDGDENVAQRLHSHSGIHAFNKSKEGEGRTKRKEKKVERVKPVV